MSKKIEFEKNGEVYTLEYSRESVQILESQGFSVAEFKSKPVTMIPLAFEGLFFKNHRGMTGKQVEEIYDGFENKTELLSFIMEAITETYNTLTAKPVEGKNISWKIVE